MGGRFLYVMERMWASSEQGTGVRGRMSWLGKGCVMEVKRISLV